MNKKPLSLAYSTCPNDTFLFHAMAHGLIPLNGLAYSIFLEDVESLNQKAFNGVYDISKLSFAAIGNLQENYGLLRSGAALGRGCGPLVIARPGYTMNHIKKNRIAVPGLLTTAHLLLGLYLGQKPDAVPMSFEKIMPSVSSGKYDFGVIIHEGRFTYPEYGLCQVVDLGAWWESETHLPIPLGGIAIKRTLPKEIIRIVETSISDSVGFAFDNPDASKPYIKQHAQEMSDSVIDQHIGLYVNDFTRDLDTEGDKAIHHFFEMARSKGIMASSNTPLYAR